ncbi:unnamed protein product [Chrysoparadoxa australica]
MAAPEAKVVDNLCTSLADCYAKELQKIWEEYPDVDEELLRMALRRRIGELVPSAMGYPRICNEVAEAIGCTAMVELSRLMEGCAPGAKVCVKLEYTNPGQSIKDRIAKSMMDEAEESGKISPEKVCVVDVSSGNTGISLGMLAASRGYRCIVVIPEGYSVERRAMMMMYGVEVIVTSKDDKMDGVLKKLKEIADSLGEAAFCTQQFSNPANIQAHVDHTGPEIWEQCEGRVDVFVAGCGTGGTLSGIGRYLKQKNEQLQLVAVDPLESAVLSGVAPGPHGIQGIGTPFIPDNVDFTWMDEIVLCPENEALAMARRLAREEGLGVGISAGANVWVALQLARRPENAGKRIVTVLPSAAERYMNTALYRDLFEASKNLPTVCGDPEVDLTGFVNLLDLPARTAATDIPLGDTLKASIAANQEVAAAAKRD